MGEWYSLSADIYGAVLVDGISSIEKLVQMNILLDKKTPRDATKIKDERVKQYFIPDDFSKKE